MGETHIKVDVCGLKKCREIEFIVDSGATYITLTKDIIEDIGASPTPHTIELETPSEEKIKSKLYAVTIEYNGRKTATFIAEFPYKKFYFGNRGLQDLNAYVDPVEEKIVLKPFKERV